LGNDEKLFSGNIFLKSFGLALREVHYEAILESLPKLDWLEITTENYLVPGGKPIYYLERMLEHYPVTLHGVSLSLGSTDPLDMTYLKQVKELADKTKPLWISDHLCWTKINNIHLHDLLPLPYTEESLAHVVNNITKVQEYLGQRILIENVSSYLTYAESEMTEWEFVAEIAERTDCYILLDINNIYVSAFNHRFKPQDYFRGIPRARVKQIHLAGHSVRGDYLIDTHDAPVTDAVWDLYSAAIKYFGAVPTLLERDSNIPPLEDLLAELNHARGIVKEIIDTSIQI
jgi:uncharacterized protein (UPF0276 family)